MKAAGQVTVMRRWSHSVSWCMEWRALQKRGSTPLHVPGEELHLVCSSKLKDLFLVYFCNILELKLKRSFFRHLQHIEGFADGAQYNFNNNAKCQTVRKIRLKTILFATVTFASFPNAKDFVERRRRGLTEA